MAGTIWLDGALAPSGEDRVSCADRGFLLGDGLFETMRLMDGHLPHLERHLTRLEEGCAVLMLPPPERATVRRAVEDLVAANGTTDGSVRLTLTRGAGPRGLLPPARPSPTLLLTCAAAARQAAPAVRLGLSRYIRDGASPLSRVKTLNYLPMVMARMEAVAAGYDDALLPGQGGETVAEASASNIVMLLDGELVTPPLSDGALPGTSRARLLEAGICRERTVPLRRLGDIAAAWLISSLSVQAVASIGDRSLSEGTPQGPELRELLLGKNMIF